MIAIVISRSMIMIMIEEGIYRDALIYNRCLTYIRSIHPDRICATCRSHRNTVKELSFLFYFLQRLYNNSLILIIFIRLGIMIKRKEGTPRITPFCKTLGEGSELTGPIVFFLAEMEKVAKYQRSSYPITADT